MIAFLKDRLFALRLPVLALVVLMVPAAIYYTMPFSLAGTGFHRHLPSDHPFMEVLRQYEGRFLGTNRVDIMVRSQTGTIWNETFFKTYKALTDEIYQLPGVSQTSIRSLWSEKARYLKSGDDGFARESVIPPKADPDALTDEMLATIRLNTIRGNHIGHLVSADEKSVLISVEIFDRDPLSGRRLDYLKLSAALEKLRDKYSTTSTDIAITGYAEQRGALAGYMPSILLFLGGTLCIAACGLFLYAPTYKSVLAAWFSISLPLAGQMIFLERWGDGLDPLSFPILFFTLSLGFPAAALQLQAFALARRDGQSTAQAAWTVFDRNMMPLLAWFAVLLTASAALYMISIPSVREEAAAGLLGVGLLTISILVVLPFSLSLGKAESVARQSRLHDRLAEFVDPRRKRLSLLICVACAAALFAASSQRAGDMSNGDAPVFAHDARYNHDAAMMLRDFPTELHDFIVIAELPPNGCLDYPKLEFLNLFSGQMENVPGVVQVKSLSFALKASAARLNDGNLKWQSIPRTRDMLARAVTITPSRGLMLGPACSVLPVHIFLADSRPATIAGLVEATRHFMASYAIDGVALKMASGSIGVQGAVLETVRHALLPMLAWVGIVFCAFLIMSCRSMEAVMRCAVPAGVLFLCAWSLPGFWDIRLDAASAPVPITMLISGLAVILVLHRQIDLHLKDGGNISESVQAALSERGRLILMSGLTMMLAASVWIAAPLKFQSDMGLLCASQILAGLIAGLWVLPLWSRVLDAIWPHIGRG